MIDFNTNTVLKDVVVIEVRGALNEMSRTYFFQCIEDLFADGARHVIVDCSGLGVLNSSGMSALLTSRNRAQRHGGKIYLTHLNSTISSALEFTRPWVTVFHLPDDGGAGRQVEKSCRETGLRHGLNARDVCSFSAAEEEDFPVK